MKMSERFKYSEAPWGLWLVIALFVSLPFLILLIVQVGNEIDETKVNTKVVGWSIVILVTGIICWQGYLKTKRK